MNITKKKQTHRYREHVSGYQWGERRMKGQNRGEDSEVQTIRCEINKLQGYIVQHREYSQYFIVTINGAELLKIVDHYVVHL